MSRLDICPYPRLWEAFANDEEVFAKLDKALPFDVLTEASRRLAIMGQYSARAFILGAFVENSSAGTIDKAAIFDSYDEWARSRSP